MTREQLQAARDEQSKRYPLLDFFLAIGPVLFSLAGGAGTVTGLLVALTGLSAGNTSQVVAGALSICVAVLLSLSAIASLEWIRLFMDIEIHTRRFVDGD